MAGHFGVERTLEKIQRSHTWPGIRRDVEVYIRKCVLCQRCNARNHAPYGHLVPLPEPDGPWQWITMDFVTDLPLAKYNGQVYDSILVVMDRFSKMVHYIPSRKDIDAKTLSDVFMREV